MNILFWNLKNNNVSEYIATCLSEHDIDIAVFSENKNIDFLGLSQSTVYNFIEGMGGCEKIVMLAKSSIAVEIKQEQSRYALYHVTKGSSQYVLAGIHLQDRHTTDTVARVACIGRLVNDISNVERRCKCKNTIIIGDFNANPYDDELLQMNAFNAVLFKEVIQKSETRTVDGVTYRRFYNPTINFVLEDTKNYGSFYYTNGSNSPVWHCLDQVLLSRALVDNIVSMSYLKRIGNKSLIKNVKPNKEISDHLPLLVNIR